jgi:hypothetical protein
VYLPANSTVTGAAAVRTIDGSMTLAMAIGTTIARQRPHRQRAFSKFNARGLNIDRRT